MPLDFFRMKEGPTIREARTVLFIIAVQGGNKYHRYKSSVCTIVSSSIVVVVWNLRSDAVHLD